MAKVGANRSSHPSPETLMYKKPLTRLFNGGWVSREHHLLMWGDTYTCGGIANASGEHCLKPFRCYTHKYWCHECLKWSREESLHTHQATI